MNKISALLMVAAVSFSGTAYAQPASPPDPFGDATVTKADAEKTAVARFDALDTNKDGNLSADEIAAAPGGRGLARADMNGDGSVTKAEFAAWQGRRFDMMDGNHDGQLTKAERDDFRQKMMARMRDRSGPGGAPAVMPEGH